MAKTTREIAPEVANQALSKQPIFLATFKGYYSIDQTIAMVEQLLEKVKALAFPLHIAAPLDFITPLTKHFAEQPIAFGADIMPSSEPTAFTGSIAGLCLQKLGCKFALIGTAQERTIYALSGPALKNKIEEALKTEIHPIFAIGESLHEFEDSISEKIFSQQLSDTLEGLSKEQLDKISILYDAPWLSDSPWGDTSEYAPKAYGKFVKAIQDYFKSKGAAPSLLFSIPCFAEHLPKTPSDANCGGYYAGVFTPSHAIEPIHLHAEAPPHEAPKPETKAEDPPKAKEADAANPPPPSDKKT